jgi:hypothetical protein
MIEILGDWYYFVVLHVQKIDEVESIQIDSQIVWVIVTLQVLDACRLRRPGRRRERSWGHLGAEPRRPRQEDCVPCTPT